MKQINQNAFTKLREASVKEHIDANTTKSYDWFKVQIRKLNRKYYSQKRFMQDANRKVVTITPGKMYMYEYLPKYKTTLPYYDRFPLVIPFAIHNSGNPRAPQYGKSASWVGLNLHYLDVRTRLLLLDKLEYFRTNNDFDEKTKYYFTWKILKRFTKLAVPCVKRYLGHKVVTNIIEIQSYDWLIASYLPTQNFAKARDKYIWAQSKNIYRNSK